MKLLDDVFNVLHKIEFYSNVNNDDISHDKQLFLDNLTTLTDKYNISIHNVLYVKCYTFQDSDPPHIILIANKDVIMCMYDSKFELYLIRGQHLSIDCNAIESIGVNMIEEVINKNIKYVLYPDFGFLSSGLLSLEDNKLLKIKKLKKIKVKSNDDGDIFFKYKDFVVKTITNENICYGVYDKNCLVSGFIDDDFNFQTGDTMTNVYEYKENIIIIENLGDVRSYIVVYF